MPNRHHRRRQQVRQGQAWKSAAKRNAVMVGHMRDLLRILDDEEAYLRAQARWPAAERERMLKSVLHSRAMTLESKARFDAVTTGQ